MPLVKQNKWAWEGPVSIWLHDELNTPIEEIRRDPHHMKLKRFFIGRHCLLSLVRGARVRVNFDIPDGASVVGIHNAPDRDAICLIVQHPDFKDLEKFEEIPIGGPGWVEWFNEESQEWIRKDG